MLVGDFLKAVAAIIAWLIFGSAAGYVALIVMAGAKKPTAEMLVGEGGGRRTRRWASDSQRTGSVRTSERGRK